MIPQSLDYDLGQDATRMKDGRHAERQRATVDVILSRFFGDDLQHRWDVQLLADEVGLGKTFIALAVAYSILVHLRRGNEEEDLRGCYQKVVVVTPQNPSLNSKWAREVSEFVRRCVLVENRQEAESWFAPVRIDRIDDLAREIRRPGGSGPRIIVTHMGVLGGAKNLRAYEAKRRYLLAALFRYWGNGFRYDSRERLLRGAPTDWPRDPRQLDSLDPKDVEQLPFASLEEAIAAIAKVAEEQEGAALLEGLLENCRAIGQPHVRDREELIRKELNQPLIELYRRAVFAGVARCLPLVVIDEAHNWKNGPTQGANGFRGFAQFLGPRSRRALLLTATPFQLRPGEMLELLRVGDNLEPCPTGTASRQRRERLAAHCQDVIGPVLNHSASQSRSFSRAWSRLPSKWSGALAPAWNSAKLIATRKELFRIANEPGVIDEAGMESLIAGALAGTEPDLRELLREALRLYAYNADLSQELGELVVRNRRRTDHRLVKVGNEYLDDTQVARRSDRHVLHGAAGMDVQGAGELPHYLLMRCVSEMKGGKGRTALGSTLTGCYSTLLQSADGRLLQKSIGSNGAAYQYFNLLRGLVGEDKDSEHPKVRAVVDSVLQNWRAGEKTLVFCFRTHTADRLAQITTERIKAELRERQARVLGGRDSLRALRSRFTGRDRDLIVLGLDRVLWSLVWAGESEGVSLDSVSPELFRLSDSDLQRVAEVALRYGVDLTAERVDRVFLHRVQEHVVAARLLASGFKSRGLRSVLQHMAEEAWVRSPYGLESEVEAEDGDGDREDAADFDERGVHSTYKLLERAPAQERVLALTQELIDRRNRAKKLEQTAVLDTYVEGPSFWGGPHPLRHLTEPESGRIARTLTHLHRHLYGLTRAGVELDWLTRLKIFQALRRALLRESVLLRLLPEKTDREESGQGELIVEAFFETLPGQAEAMSDRLVVFLEDVLGASGSVRESGSQRSNYYEASRSRQGFVSLVNGSTPPETRERAFTGFNTPLSPEVLICTTVGQEGIDLHRYCRHVVHYDLAWNPAVLEQRTGRVDRIGSKASREHAGQAESAFLEVGVPFLAGTYDERMYEELRIRAQTLEVLTGGDLSAENVEGIDGVDGAEGKEQRLVLPTLPENMMADLRVKLHVWEEEPVREGDPRS